MDYTIRESLTKKFMSSTWNQWTRFLVATIALFLRLVRRRWSFVRNAHFTGKCDATNLCNVLFPTGECFCLPTRSQKSFSTDQKIRMSSGKVSRPENRYLSHAFASTFYQSCCAMYHKPFREWLVDRLIWNPFLCFASISLFLTKLSTGTSSSCLLRYVHTRILYYGEAVYNIGLCRTTRYSFLFYDGADDTLDCHTTSSKVQVRPNFPHEGLPYLRMIRRVSQSDIIYHIWFVQNVTLF